MMGQFTDKSTNSPTSLHRDFDDGTTSTAQNLSHRYLETEKYTMSLTVKNDGGGNTRKIRPLSC
jgi:PKD repeat protein